MNFKIEVEGGIWFYRVEINVHNIEFSALISLYSVVSNSINFSILFFFVENDRESKYFYDGISGNSLQDSVKFRLFMNCLDNLV